MKLTTARHPHGFLEHHSHVNAWCPECARMNTIPTSRVNTGLPTRCFACGCWFAVDCEEVDA